MKFTDLFVRRPVLAIVVNLVILIAGLQSIRALSVRQFPRSDIAVVRVSTAYVGANADLVRGFITTPLERVIASADGIDYIESSSAQGVSTITVHLKLNHDTNAALTQIQTKVAQVRNDLPPEAQAPIIELETADTQFAAMYLGFSSKDLDQNQITDYLTRVVQPKLSAVEGVQRADILGGRTFAMRIWLEPEKIAPGPIACRPAMMITTLTTIARTGRRMKRSVKEEVFMAGLAVAASVSEWCWPLAHARSYDASGIVGLRRELRVGREFVVDFDGHAGVELEYP